MPVPVSTIAGTRLSFNAANNTVTVNTPGLYYVSWNALFDQGAGDVVVTLEDAATGTIYARSGSAGTGTSVTGSTAVTLPAGAQLALYNRSGRAITLDQAAGNGADYAASLTVVGL